MKKYPCAVCLLSLFLLSLSSGYADTTLYACHSEGELKIRETPWGDKVGYLYPGDSVEFVEEKSGWTLIRCGIDAGGGWVKSEYLTTDTGGAGEYRNNGNGRVHIRKTPKITKKNHLKWLEVGGVVTVTRWLIDEEGNEWGFTGDGYVLKDCVSKVTEQKTED